MLLYDLARLRAYFRLYPVIIKVISIRKAGATKIIFAIWRNRIEYHHNHKDKIRLIILKDKIDLYKLLLFINFSDQLKSQIEFCRTSDLRGLYNN